MNAFEPRQSWLRTAIGMLIGLAFAPALASELPTVDAANAERLEGQQASLELAVVEAKFAQRRGLYFLSGSANFRASSNVPVAIRATDFERFRAAGIEDLAAQFRGHKIRARGKVTRDEGQWLLVVSAPDQVERLDKPQDAASSYELLLIDDKGKKTKIALPLQDPARDKISVEHEGAAERYEGVPLAALLARSGIVLGAEARGRLLGRYLIVTGRDGYAAAYSLAEVDPFFAEKPALLADRIDGEALPADKAPLLMVLPGEKHHRRWVKQVIRIEVRNALEQPADGKR
ncbi:MAG TPA: molybdopterin-dependent oxidoreductase [Pirellulales bacterium]|nr:molybdopterin-dependent oxidoreductase [Pirellulales bacterium]